MCTKFAPGICQKSGLDSLAKSITDGARRKCPWGAKWKPLYTPAAIKQRDKKARRFFRDEAIHVVCRVSEKLLQRSRWNFLRRHHLNVHRLFYHGEEHFKLGHSRNGVGDVCRHYNYLSGNCRNLFSINVNECFTI